MDCVLCGGMSEEEQYFIKWFLINDRVVLKLSKISLFDRVLPKKYTPGRYFRLLVSLDSGAREKADLLKV